MSRSNWKHGAFRMAAVFTALALLSGCGYSLRGKVVRGQESSIQLVHEIDPLLKQPGIGNVEVQVRRDPNTLNTHLAGQERTNTSGDFSIPIREFGAGWMDEQWQIRAAMAGFQNAELVTKLPAKGSRWIVLVTLAPGQSAPLDQGNDPRQDYEKFK